MNTETLDLLKGSLDKKVIIFCADGEIIVGKVLFVSELEEDVIFDLVSTNKPERYTERDNSAYQLEFSEIKSVTVPES